VAKAFFSEGSGGCVNRFITSRLSEATHACELSSAESRPKPDHKVQLSHAAGVVQPAGSESKEGPSTTTASQAESLLAAEKREYGTNTHLGERKRAEEAIRANEQSLRLIVDSIPGFMNAAAAASIQDRTCSLAIGPSLESAVSMSRPGPVMIAPISEWRLIAGVWRG
jgi:PAS domain-containing protein